MATVSKSSIKRIALKASVGSLSSLVDDEIRKEISSVSEEICNKAKVLCDLRKAQTITHHDVEGAINSIYYLQDMKLGQPPGTKHRNVKACHDVSSKTFGMRNYDKITERRIKKSKEMFNCFNIPKSIFKKILDKCASNKRKSNDALIVLQEAVENHIINVFSHAQQMNENKIMKPGTINTAINMIHGQHGKTEVTHKEKFDSYIRAVFKEVHPGVSISKDALFQVNAILNLIANKFTYETIKLCQMDKKSTVSALHVQQAANMILSGELARYGKAKIVKAITRASTHRPMTINREHAELRFPPTRAGHFITKHSSRTSVSAKIALAAIIEYMCMEISEVAGIVARNHLKLTVNTRYLSLSIDNDKELSKLINNILGYKIPLTGVNTN
jgi:histone H2A